MPRLPHPCQSRPVKTSARTHCANPSLCCRRPFLMPARGHKPIAVRPSRQVSTSVPGRRYSVSRRPLAAEKQSADHASARPPSSPGGHDRHRCSPAVRGVRQHSIATGRRTSPPPEPDHRCFHSQSRPKIQTTSSPPSVRKLKAPAAAGTRSTIVEGPHTSRPVTGSGLRPKGC